jgi:four helix bundle protein
MRYKRFEDLPVWQAAIELAVAAFALMSHPVFKSHYRLREQFESAALSVSNNIAEGFERGTNKELLMFLYIARGSAGETRSMCRMFERFSRFSEVGEPTGAIASKAENCSQQLKAWISTIQNSSFKGERYVTQKLKRSELLERHRDTLSE